MPESKNKPVKLAVVLASYNRKEKTLSCIRTVADQAYALPAVGESLHIVLVDDGSTDGTADAVSAAFPFVEVIRSDGSLFWCRSMHKAQAAAMARGCEYLLWLNDDTELAPDALARAFFWDERLRVREGKPSVLVGSLRNPVTGHASYGGMMRPRWWLRTKLQIIDPGVDPVRALTLNGNFVLIPAAVFNAVGNLDARFEHAMGDMDYGLRIARTGFDIWVLPGYVGSCPRNPSRGTFVDQTLPFAKRWQHLLSPKGLPLRSWLIFTRRHAGPLWPLYWAWPYVRVLLSSVFTGRQR
jgi:GT2 family glycosyltransferase